jgi:hypothetical protein
MDELQVYREAAREHGIPESVIDWWLQLARPLAGLHRHGDGPVVGQFGGDPLLPADVEWPVHSSADFDSPIPFIASIDCGALPPGALDIAVPEDGCLLFFAENDFFGESRVIYVPEGTATFERTAPPGYGGHATDSYRRFPLHHAPHWSLPESEDISVAGFGPDSLFRQHDLGTLWWNLGGVPDAGEMTLGGHYTKLQGDPREDESWVLLAETTVDEDTLEDGEGPGIIYWVIRRADLAVKQFDRTETVKHIRD